MSDRKISWSNVIPLDKTLFIHPFEVVSSGMDAPGNTAVAPLQINVNGFCWQGQIRLIKELEDQYGLGFSWHSVRKMGEYRFNVSSYTHINPRVSNCSYNYGIPKTSWKIISGLCVLIEVNNHSGPVAHRFEAENPGEARGGCGNTTMRHNALNGQKRTERVVTDYHWITAADALDEQARAIEVDV